MEEVFKTSIKTLRRSFFKNCNYDVSDYAISSQFYRELLLWCPQFRGMFASERNWQRIVRKIRIDKKTIYFQSYYESGIVCVSDLLFNLSSNDSFTYFAKKKSVKSTFSNGHAFNSLYLTFKRRFHIPAINLSFISHSQ